MLRGIRVTFADGNTIETSINGTDQEIRAYYLGNTDGFQFGDTDEHPADKLVKAVAVEFLEPHRHLCPTCREKERKLRRIATRVTRRNRCGRPEEELWFEAGGPPGHGDDANDEMNRSGIHG